MPSSYGKDKAPPEPAQVTGVEPAKRVLNELVPYRHVGNGDLYRVLWLAKMQSRRHPELDQVDVVVYRKLFGVGIFVREVDEFLERFTPLDNVLKMENEQEARMRYEAALHAMQSGVRMEMNLRTGPTEPKHLRTGINAAQSDQSGLATLLIQKGVFTREEYATAMADAMELEKQRYEEHLSQLLGRKVSLA